MNNMSGRSKKKIPLSICCLTYNHKPFIEKAINSFLTQKTNFSFEVLIHDDASTDGTSEIVKAYESKYPSIIKPIYQTENQWSKGLRSITVNYNFTRAKGKYIAICEGDDYWTDPHKLQKQVEFLEENEEYVMCFTNVCVINEMGTVLNKRKITNYHNNEYSHHDVPFYAPTATRVFKNDDNF